MVDLLPDKPVVLFCVIFCAIPEVAPAESITQDSHTQVQTRSHTCPWTAQPGCSYTCTSIKEM